MIKSGQVVVGLAWTSLYKESELSFVIPRRPDGSCSIRVGEPALALDSAAVRGQAGWRNFTAIKIMLPDGIVGWIDNDYIAHIAEVCK